MCSSDLPLDSATVAIGTVISTSKKKIINHLEGGIIKNIYIKVGDKVNAEDKLIELDDIKIKAQYEITLNQYRTFLAAEKRLLAEINADNEIEYPEFILQDKSVPSVAKHIETQNSIFHSQR